MPLTLDFKLIGQIKILRVARKVGCKISKLKLNRVCVGVRVDPKDGKKRVLKRNIQKTEKLKV